MATCAPTAAVVPAIMNGFIANAVAIAVVAGRFGVVTTTMTRYAAITTMPTVVPLSSACNALTDRCFRNIEVNVCCPTYVMFGHLIIYLDTLTVKKKVYCAEGGSQLM